VLFIILSFISPQTSFGAIDISSVLNFKYDTFHNLGILDAILYFSNRVNDNAYAYMTLEYISPQYNTPVSVTGTAYFIYTIKPNLGTFTVGYFSENLGNPSLLSSAVSDLKSYSGLKCERPIVDKLSFEIGYYPNEQNNISSSYSVTSAYSLGLNYKKPEFGGQLNLVKFSITDPLSSVTYLYYKPNQVLNAYIHYSYLQKYNFTPPSTESIAGVMLTLPPVTNPFIINLEYNWENDPANLFAYRIIYNIDKNIVISYYNYIRTSEIHELRLSIIW
jgi:hypothetical protein